jgi:hypothetical protein
VSFVAGEKFPSFLRNSGLGGGNELEAEVLCFTRKPLELPFFVLLLVTILAATTSISAKIVMNSNTKKGR